MQRLRPPAAIVAGALALWLPLPAHVNYDTAWSLVWGGELARGAQPNLEALSAPTPHPLGMLLGVLLAPLGAAAGDVATLLVLGSLAAVVWLAHALGRAWFGGAAGWIAAGLALTSVPLLTTAGRGRISISPTSRSCWERSWSRPGAGERGRRCSRCSAWRDSGAPRRGCSRPAT